MAIYSSEDTLDGWDLRSDPPDGQDEEVISSKITVETPRRNKETYSQSSDSLADEILSARRTTYRGIFPSYSSSPTQVYRRHHQEQNQKLQKARELIRSGKALKARGGIENMEKFVLRGEQLEEAKRMQQQAQEHEIPDDLLETFELEQQEDLEDAELIDIIDKREQWEKELDQFLSELIIE